MMSISNTTRAIAHVSVTSASLGLNDSQYKRRIEQVEGKVHSYRKADQKVKESAKKSHNSGQNFTSTAHELYSNVSNTFNELVNLTQQRLSPLAYVNINTAPDSKFNNVDLKRHQNYFNQMMRYDNPSGTWIDTRI